MLVKEWRNGDFHTRLVGVEIEPTFQRSNLAIHHRRPKQHFIRIDPVCSLVQVWILKNDYREFPGSAVVRTPCFHCQGCRFNPWSGN